MTVFVSAQDPSIPPKAKQDTVVLLFRTIREAQLHFKCIGILIDI